MIHQVVIERKEAGRRRSEEAARWHKQEQKRQAEEQARKQVEDQRQRAEAECRTSIQNQRQSDGLCTMWACRWVSLTGCLDNPSTGTAIDFQNQALKDFRDHRSVPNYRFW